MTRWMLAPDDCVCGGSCGGTTIRAHHPVQLVEIPGVKRVLMRCETCAGPAPPGLPDFTDAPPAPRADAFVPLMSAAPHRTRSGFRQAVDRWMPYKDSET